MRTVKVKLEDNISRAAGIASSHFNSSDRITHVGRGISKLKGYYLEEVDLSN
jgi:hypothetical protein